MCELGKIVADLFGAVRVAGAKDSMPDTAVVCSGITAVCGALL